MKPAQAVVTLSLLVLVVAVALGVIAAGSALHGIGDAIGQVLR